MTELEHAARYLVAAVNDEISREMAKMWGEIERRFEEHQPKATQKRDQKERFLNQRQAAEFLGCSVSFIRKQRLAGDFPQPTKINSRNLRWAESELRAWAESNRLGDQEAEASRSGTT